MVVTIPPMRFIIFPLDRCVLAPDPPAAHTSDWAINTLLSGIDCDGTASRTEIGTR